MTDDEKEFNRKFGSTVARRRMELQIAQEDVALLLSLPRTAITAIEGGHRGISFFEAKVLMACLGIRPKDLYDTEVFTNVYAPKLRALCKARDLAKLRNSIGRKAYEEESETSGAE